MFLLAPPAALALAASALAPRWPCVFFDSPPTPTCGGVLNVEVGHTLTFTVQASDDTCTLPIFLEAGLLELPGATTNPPLPTSAPSVVSCVVTWTPDASNVGTHGIVFHAVSGCCPSDAWCSMTVNVTNTPPCPPCVDTQFGLGSAGGCTVLELGTGQVSITGPAGGILGDVCIAPGGKLSISGSEFVTGAIRLGAGASYSHSGSGTTGPVLTNVDLSAEINDAQAAASADAALSCTQSFGTLNNNLTIVGNGGLNVICVTDVVLNGKTVTLSGGPSDLFVFKVTGKFVLNGGGKILASGLPASSVLYDILGTGQDVAFTGGGGGVGCCNSKVDGTLLAPQRKVNLSPGLVNGEVISGRDISIVSGSSVRCPACP